MRTEKINQEKVIPTWDIKKSSFTRSTMHIMAKNTKSTTACLSTRPHRLLNTRMIQNFHLVWLDGSIDETNEDCGNSITKLREVVHTVNTFVNVDECIDFITDVAENVFVVISGEFSGNIISIIQDISQVYCVYIFYKNNVPYEKQTMEPVKMNCIFTDITSICEALKKVTQKSDHNSVSISFVKMTDGAAKQSLDTLDCSFMYTQILKEILLTIDFEQIHFNEFISYCREQFVNPTAEMKNIDKIEKEYHAHQPIWWYTYPCFLYSMLNKALRTMDVNLIVKMGFFVRDLYNHIATLHAEQYGEKKSYPHSFTVYRGQGLSQIDFEQMKKTQGGLMSFNNFLSTSLNRAVSFAFADANQYDPNLIGVLFEINIDPSMSSSSFANVKNASYFQGEEEILFSMHSVFRIGQVKEIEKNNDRLWQVELTLTSDNDPQLQELTKSMQEDTKGPTGWFRLGRLMMKVAQLDKAQQVFEMILYRTTDEKYTEALSSYEKALEIWQKTLPANHSHLAISYNNIGSVYDNMGEYSKALSSYGKALEIWQKTLPENHPDLATSYDNIGLVYYNMGEYSKALSYYGKALEIRQKTLPANHPDLATSYNNIGLGYYNMGEYSKALTYAERALDIWQRSLPPNHPRLKIVKNNIEIVKCFLLFCIENKRF